MMGTTIDMTERTPTEEQEATQINMTSCMIDMRLVDTTRAGMVMTSEAADMVDMKGEGTMSAMAAHTMMISLLADGMMCPLGGMLNRPLGGTTTCLLGGTMMHPLGDMVTCPHDAGKMTTLHGAMRIDMATATCPHGVMGTCHPGAMLTCHPGVMKTCLHTKRCWSPATPIAAVLSPAARHHVTSTTR